MIYRSWLEDVSHELWRYGFTTDEITEMFHSRDWLVYYLNGLSPWDAARQQLTHWE